MRTISCYSFILMSWKWSEDISRKKSRRKVFSRIYSSWL